MLQGTGDDARQAAYDSGIAWQALDPALNAPARSVYSGVGDTAFQTTYGVAVIQGDTIPVVFSHPVLGSSIRPDAFEILLNTGEWVTPLTASLLPTEFSRYFRVEAVDALGETVWIDEAGVAYDIAGHGTVRVLGIADTGPRQERYDDAYVEDHDNQYDIILAGDRSAVEQLVRVHMPAEGPYSAVYNPGGPGNAPESNPDVPFTVPSSPQSIGISNLIGQDPYVTYVEVDGAVYRDPVTGQPVAEDLGIALHDTGTGHVVHFTEYGMNEFRAPNALGQQKPLTEENLLAYAKANPDLLLAYEVPASATSLAAQQRHDLALHFHRWGHAEGRAAEPTQLVAPSPGDRIGADDDIWFELVGTIGGTTHEWVAFSPLS